MTYMTPEDRRKAELLAHVRRLQSRLDGVCGALSDAENIIFSMDDPEDGVRHLIADRDEWRRRAVLAEGGLVP